MIDASSAEAVEAPRSMSASFAPIAAFATDSTMRDETPAVNPTAESRRCPRTNCDTSRALICRRMGDIISRARRVNSRSASCEPRELAGMTSTMEASRTRHCSKASSCRRTATKSLASSVERPGAPVGRTSQSPTSRFLLERRARREGVSACRRGFFRVRDTSRPRKCRRSMQLPG
jgi:hypothetical protein